MGLFIGNQHAQVERKDDGTVTFRLLAESQRSVTVDDWTVILLDVATGMVEREGIVTDAPVARIEVTRLGRTAPLELWPGDPQEALGLVVRFRYTVDGEIPGLPRQSGGYFAVRAKVG